MGERITDGRNFVEAGKSEGEASDSETASHDLAKSALWPPGDVHTDTRVQGSIRGRRGVAECGCWRIGILVCANPRASSVLHSVKKNTVKKNNLSSSPDC